LAEWSRTDHADPLGAVTYAFEETLHAIRQQSLELQRDRARMEAILVGMVEGVIVVDGRGHVQLPNDAARSLLKTGDAPVGRPYVGLSAIRRCRSLCAPGCRVRERTPWNCHCHATRAAYSRHAPRQPHRVMRMAPCWCCTTSRRCRADQIRRDFVANVSHELRTTLTAIRGYAEALAERTVTDEERRSFVETIMRHTTRMERLVSDLLRLARLDAGQESLDQSWFELAGLLAEVVEELGPALSSRTERVVVDIGDDAARVYADRGKLHDLLRNLIANAITYNACDAAIVVSARVVDAEVSIAWQIADRAFRNRI
jgi:two-component system phosphate regulon sensor histidine kinase PhoR